jgi:hypothetical protein
MSFSSVENDVFFGGDSFSNTEENQEETSESGSEETTFKDFYDDRQQLKDIQETSRGEEFTDEELESKTADEFREENDLYVTDFVAENEDVDFEDVTPEKKFASGLEDNSLDAFTDGVNDGINNFKDGVGGAVDDATSGVQDRIQDGLNPLSNLPMDKIKKYGLILVGLIVAGVGLYFLIPAIPAILSILK